LVWRIL